jgi:nicotinamide phosphoribosyltransferase
MEKKLEKRMRERKKIVTDEINGIRHLLSVYPTGILSMVSDTFDLWRMLTDYLPRLKEEILARDGKLVIRPDSGDPVDIICGNVNPAYRTGIASKNRTNWSPEERGVIELLWDVFGGTINEQGYKVLDSHIGAIYGDSITLDRAEQIFTRLEAKGFASTNIVFGVGSFTYQYNTRDTFGFAMKATYVEVDGEGREIFKDPITDDGVKKSAKGLLSIHNHDGEYVLIDQCTWKHEATGHLKTIYLNGQFENRITLNEIREQLRSQY